MRVSASQLVAFGVLDAEVLGVVDRRLSPQRTALLEVLLGLGVFVVRLDLRLDAAGDHAGPEPPRGTAADPAGEDKLHVVRTPERELVFEHQLKPLSDLGGAVGHARVGELELADREPVAVAPLAVSGIQRRGQVRLPVLEEPPDIAVVEGVQRDGVLDRPKPVIQRLERDPPLGGLPLGPLVPIEVDPHTVRGVGDRLDERRSPLAAADVEIEVVGEHRHPPVAEMRVRVRTAVSIAPPG